MVEGGENPHQNHRARSSKEKTKLISGAPPVALCYSAPCIATGWSWSRGTLPPPVLASKHRGDPSSVTLLQLNQAGCSIGGRPTKEAVQRRCFVLFWCRWLRVRYTEKVLESASSLFPLKGSWLQYQAKAISVAGSLKV